MVNISVPAVKEVPLFLIACETVINCLIIKRTLPRGDNLGGRVAGKWDRGGELFSITCYYFSVEFKGF